jgi:CYTH domain-containing protein
MAPKPATIPTAAARIAIVACSLERNDAKFLLFMLLSSTFIGQAVINVIEKIRHWLRHEYHK